MVNQNVLDLASCLLLVAVYVLKISDLNLAGVLGYSLCMLLLSENLLWFATEGSVINLAVITIERYLKVVHPIWSKKKLRKEIIHLFAALPWVISFIYNMTTAFTTRYLISLITFVTKIKTVDDGWNSILNSFVVGITVKCMSNESGWTRSYCNQIYHTKIQT